MRYKTIVKVKGKAIGTVWFARGVWHAEYDKTGCTWEGETKQDMIELLESEARYAS